MSNFINSPNFETLIGQTLVSAIATEDTVTFVTSGGRSYRLYHDQDCCESVGIDHIEGNLSDLIGDPLIEASEEISNTNPPGFTREYQESFTWTTFTLATAKARVRLVWYGESNGYYSESVSFTEIK